MYKRTIPPIGQGCCVEQVLTLNGKSVRLLYDCGPFQNRYVKRFINKMDTKIKTFLVISHLHRDHISGIPELLEHFEGTEKI
jgi:glyoxylase-like metal-dependent hydrolase (beta-lactamase superfamily II)